MDFGFGEIVEPVSRAFYDDYDDQRQNLPFNKNPEWIWNIEEAKLRSCDVIENFIIIEGTNAIKVVNPILKNKSCIARLKDHKVEISQIENFTICVVEEKDLNYFATIAMLLEPYVSRAENCSYVSLQSLSEFKADEVNETFIIRSINSKLKNIAALEAPNFTTGIGAGIGTFRHINNLAFSCITVYIDLFDLISINGILEILKSMQVPHDMSIPLKSLEHKSNMYM